MPTGQRPTSPFAPRDFRLVPLRRTADHDPGPVEDLTPRSRTVDEAARAFAPARPLEGTAPTRRGPALTAPDTAGVRRAVAAEFTRGLSRRTAVSGSRP